MSFKEEIKAIIENSINVKLNLLNNYEQILTINFIVQETIKAYRQQKKILLAGNGGSAGDASHIAGELVGRFYFDRPALAAISLTTDTSILTGIANDYNNENIFSRQIEALGKEGDIFIAISTSGQSPNILKAIEQANKQGLITIGFTGENNLMSQYC